MRGAKHLYVTVCYMRKTETKRERTEEGIEREKRREKKERRRKEEREKQKKKDRDRVIKLVFPPQSLPMKRFCRLQVRSPLMQPRRVAHGGDARAALTGFLQKP